MIFFDCKSIVSWEPTFFSITSFKTLYSYGDFFFSDIPHLEKTNRQSFKNYLFYYYYYSWIKEYLSRSQQRDPSVRSHLCEVAGDHRAECCMDSLGWFSEDPHWMYVHISTKASILLSWRGEQDEPSGAVCACVEAECFCLWSQWSAWPTHTLSGIAAQHHSCLQLGTKNSVCLYMCVCVYTRNVFIHRHMHTHMLKNPSNFAEYFT